MESPPHPFGSEDVYTDSAYKSRGEGLPCAHGQNNRRRLLTAAGFIVTFALGNASPTLVHHIVQDLDLAPGLGDQPNPGPQIDPAPPAVSGIATHYLAGTANAFDKEHDFMNRASPPSDSFLSSYHQQPSDASSSGLMTHYSEDLDTLPLTTKAPSHSASATKDAPCNLGKGGNQPLPSFGV